MSDRLVDCYLEWCFANSKPAVLLYPDHCHLAVIDYRFPSPAYVLTDQATERIRSRAERIPGEQEHQQFVITRRGGEITGLEWGRAEELAFWIADACIDPEQTEGEKALAPPRDT